MAMFTFPPVVVSFPAGGATETTLEAVATNTGDTASVLTARLSGSLVPAAYDYVSNTYLVGGDGDGQIGTVVYKLGGSGGSTVATLTFTYDSSHRLATVTKS